MTAGATDRRWSEGAEEATRTPRAPEGSAGRQGGRERGSGVGKRPPLGIWIQSTALQLVYELFQNGKF